jgi:hypothetical protein
MPNQPLSASNLQISKFQKFEITTIPREQIKNALYNPRVIDQSARIRLKKSLSTDGLLEPLVWNKKTGNLISGHQRIAIMDDLEGTNQYLLTVSQLDVSDKKEKQLNIFFNNPKAQGNYDFEKLAEIFVEESFNFEASGFDSVDFFEITGIEPKEDKINNISTKDITDKISDIKSARKKMKETADARDDVNYYLNIVFQSSRDCDNFLEAFDLPKSERYIDGNILLRLLKDK